MALTLLLRTKGRGKFPREGAGLLERSGWQRVPRTDEQRAVGCKNQRE